MSTFGDGSFEHPIRLARDVTAAFAWAEKEIERLLAEVERLTNDRNCEKRMRQDAEEARENALAEVERIKADKARINELLSEYISIESVDYDEYAMADMATSSG